MNKEEILLCIDELAKLDTIEQGKITDTKYLVLSMFFKLPGKTRDDFNRLNGIIIDSDLLYLSQSNRDKKQ